MVLPLDCVAKAPWILSSARLLAFPSSICYFRLIFFLLHLFQLAVVVLVTLAVIAHTQNLFSFVDLMMHRLFVVPFAICLFFFMHHSTIFLKRKFTFNKWVERSSTFKWKRIEKLKFLSCGCRFLCYFSSWSTTSGPASVNHFALQPKPLQFNVLPQVHSTHKNCIGRKLIAAGFVSRIVSRAIRSHRNERGTGY